MSTYGQQAPGYPSPGYQAPAAASPSTNRDPTAVMGARCVAWLVDAVLLVALMLFFAPTPLSPFAEYVDNENDLENPCEVLRDDPDLDVPDFGGCLEIGDKVYYTETTDAIVQVAVQAAWFLLVLVVWQGYTGMTPGKALLGLRTVGEDGRPPGAGKAFIRSILWIVDGLPGIPLVGFITGLTSTGHRRVGDMAAKTYVVGKADTGSPIVVPSYSPAQPYGTPTYTAPGYGTSQPTGASTWTGQTTTPTGVGGGWGAAQPPSQPGTTYPSQPPTAPGGIGQPAPSQETPPPSVTPTHAQPGTPSPWPPSVGETPATPAAPTPSPGPEAQPSVDQFQQPAEPPPAAAEEAAPPAAEPEQPATSPFSAPTGVHSAPDAGLGGEQPAAEPEATPGTTAPAAEPSAPADTATQGSGYEPQWDPARNTYIQWDPNRGRWLQWDDTTKEWTVI